MNINNIGWEVIEQWIGINMKGVRGNEDPADRNAGARKIREKLKPERYSLLL